MANESRDGIETQGDGTIEGLMALIPNPDGTAYQSAAAGNLDEMFPSTASALLAELQLIADTIGGADTNILAAGEHTITSDEATANQVDIVTGLADLTIANCIVSVFNGATRIVTDMAVTEPSAGTIRVADGSTYNTVAGYIIRWAVTSG